MARLLDLANHPWVSLVAPKDLAGMRKDLASGADPEHCSHGDSVEAVVRQWRYFALDSVAAPTDWTAFSPAAELWFSFLEGAAQAECRAEFLAASSDAEREELFYAWRSTGAILSDPELSARLREPDLEPLDAAL
jgi:hypothetical protein